MIAVPGLMAGIALRGADQTLKHSIDKTGRELLFVPVSLRKKKQVKVFVDLFVDQGAQGMAGALLLLFTAVFGLSLSHLGLVVLALIVVWGVLAYLARRSYVNEFRKRLRKQEKKKDSSGSPELSETLDELLESLCSRSETETLAALQQLEEGDETVPVDALLCLLDHYSADVRARAIRVLRVRTIEGLGSDIVEALTDPDPDVQLEAARYLYCQSGERIERLKEALSHDDVRIRAAAVGLVAEEGGPDTYRLITEATLRQLLEVPGEAGEDARTHVARILGVLDRSYRTEMLQALLHDPSDQVVEAAIRAAGRSGDRAFVYPLLVRLKNPAFEEAAREALASFGQRVLGTLYDVMVDPAVGLEVRTQVPRILTELQHDLAVTVLVAALDDVPVPVRHAIVQALSRLHASGYGSFASDSFASDDVARAVRREIRHYAALGQVLHLMNRTHRPAIGAVERADVTTARERSLERTFRMLGLQYDQRDVYDAYLGITSDDPTLRSSAVEFVDNLVDYSTSRILLPLLDDPSGRKAVEYGQRHFDRELRTLSDAREYLSSVDDPMLSPDGKASAQIGSDGDRRRVARPGLRAVAGSGDAAGPDGVSSGRSSAALPAAPSDAFVSDSPAVDNPAADDHAADDPAVDEA
jgi:HEAT repeat protein